MDSMWMVKMISMGSNGWLIRALQVNLQVIK